jgi:hypothetical protein
VQRYIDDDDADSNGDQQSGDAVVDLMCAAAD